MRDRPADQSDSSSGNGASQWHAPRRIVVKLGTNLITNARGTIDEAMLTGLVDQLAEVHASGTEVLVVTSGAVGAGREVLSRSQSPEKLQRRPVAYRQALAALGQTQLMMMYERLFDRHNIQVAQALISRGDLARRVGYLNVRNTLEALLEIGAVPIINENDVVAIEELSGVVYGDNDRLSAMVANAVDAELLILLGEMPGLFSADPNLDSTARIIAEVPRITAEIRKMAGGPHDGRGSGGMASKLEAADLATSSGTPMVIASGRDENAIKRICDGERIGTWFATRVSRIEAHKRWMMTGVTDNHGWVSVDEGAAEALQKRGVSLLPAGITGVTGRFERGDIIGVRDRTGRVIAWGLASYPSSDIQEIKGRKSSEVLSLLGHYYGVEVVHRNNMALV